MKIAYYCQHVLGVGHFHRSLEICRACAVDHDVTMVIGGPPVDVSAEPFSFFQLPGLKMDEQFSGLMPCDETATLEATKTARTERLLSFFQDFAPDALILELYPFGRKAFRFELTPLLEAAAQTSCRILCSLRDILVEKKEEQRKHEQRAVDTLNHYFDALLIHSDPHLVTLDETFALTASIQVPVQYTGFVTPRPAGNARAEIRAALDLKPEEPLVVASIGSGSVGAELLQAVCEAARTLVDAAPCRFHLFTGSYCPPAVFEALAAHAQERLVVERFSRNFPDWLAAADLSVSMAGYNTSMNIVAAGVPALMLPFDQNREQRLRLTRLTRSHPIMLLETEDLRAERLVPLIKAQWDTPRYQTGLSLDGAAQTARYLQVLRP